MQNINRFQVLSFYFGAGKLLAANHGKGNGVFRDDYDLSTRALAQNGRFTGLPK